MISVENVDGVLVIFDQSRRLGLMKMHPEKGDFYVTKIHLINKVPAIEFFLKCEEDNMLEVIIERLNDDLSKDQEQLLVMGYVSEVSPNLDGEYCTVAIKNLGEDGLETHVVYPILKSGTSPTPKEKPQTTEVPELPFQSGNYEDL